MFLIDVHLLFVYAVIIKHERVKLGGGIGVALSGWLLDISGYINLDNVVQPDSCINMMYFMYLWLPFIFDIVIAVILSFLNVERANMKLKENMLNQ